MTGIASSVADELALGHGALAAAGAALVLSFVAGAMVSAFLVNWARRRTWDAEYSLAISFEASLLLLFGVLSANLDRASQLLVPTAALLLCFLMGLQNAVITKISRAEIRTTHVTGLLTDIGIELGRMLYWNRSAPGNANHMVVGDRERLRLHVLIFAMFMTGGVVGAIGFGRYGFAATIPLAFLLLAISLPSLIRDAAFTRRS